MFKSINIKLIKDYKQTLYYDAFMKMFTRLLSALLVLLLANTSTAQSLTPGVEYQETSFLLSVVGGGWSLVTDAGARGGQYYAGLQAFSDTPTVEWRFYGDSFVLFYVTSNVGQTNATLRVTNLDTGTTSDATLNFYTPSVTYRSVTVAGLAIANYEVAVIASCCAGGYVSLDAVYIPTPAVPTPLPTATPVPTATQGAEATLQVEVTVEVLVETTPEAWREEFTLTSGERSRGVAVDYRVDAGQIALLGLTGGIFVLLSLLLVIGMRSK